MSAHTPQRKSGSAAAAASAAGSGNGAGRPAGRSRHAPAVLASRAPPAASAALPAARPPQPAQPSRQVVRQTKEDDEQSSSSSDSSISDDEEEHGDRGRSSDDDSSSDASAPARPSAAVVAAADAAIPDAGDELSSLLGGVQLRASVPTAIELDDPDLSSSSAARLLRTQQQQHVPAAGSLKLDPSSALGIITASAQPLKPTATAVAITTTTKAVAPTAAPAPITTAAISATKPAAPSNLNFPSSRPQQIVPRSGSSTSITSALPAATPAFASSSASLPAGPRPTQPPLPASSLASNPHVVSQSSAATIESELRKQVSFLTSASSATLLAGLPDKGAALRHRVALLEQALPYARAREAAEQAARMDAQPTPAHMSVAVRPAAGSLMVKPLAASGAAATGAAFGSAPAGAHPLFGSQGGGGTTDASAAGGGRKIQTITLASAAAYAPSAKQGGRKAEHGFYSLGAISQAGRTGGSHTKGDPVDEDSLQELLNSLNKLDVSAAPSPADEDAAKGSRSSSSASSHSSAAQSAPIVSVPGLKASTTLLPHQVTALTWMQRREAAAEAGSTESTSSSSATPRGGIVADDCGLGKSLQMLALILTSLRDEPRAPDRTPKHVGSAEAAGGVGPQSAGKGAKSSSSKPSSARSSCFVPSTGTLIVCPKAVLNSWRMEIDKHVDLDRFRNPRGKPLRVVTYHGPERSTWRDSKLLARKADIVLTTYETALRERSPKEVRAEDRDAPSRRQRNGSGSDSDDDDDDDDNGSDSGEWGIMGVYWRRIILDEAHHMRNGRTETARVICTLLEGERRWTLSGTPLQNALDDLYTSFWFLRFKPYSDWDTWKRLVSRHPAGERAGLEVLRTLLSAVAMRRTKNDMVTVTQHDEQNGTSKTVSTPLVALPPKHFKVHRLEFTEKERKFYEQLRAGFSEDVRIAAAGAGARASKKDVVAAGKKPPSSSAAPSSSSSLSMSDLLVKLLRLRQCCDHYLLAVEGMRASAASRAAQSRTGSKRTGKKRVEGRMQRVVEEACAKIQLKLPGGNSNNKVSSSDSDSDDDDDDSDDDDDDTASSCCRLCLDALPINGGVLMRCQHRFCLDCLRPVMEEAGGQMISCPVCEQSIKAKDIAAQIERAEKAEAAAATASSSSADKRKEGVDTADMRSILSSAGGSVAPGSSSSAASSRGPDGADASEDVLSTAKLSWLRHELWRIKLAPGSAARDKVVLFSQWTSMLDVVEVLLDREQERAERDSDARAKGVSFRYARLDGSQSRAAQHTSLSRFSADDDSVSILLLSLSAGGTGLTLTAANHLVMLDLWWNPGLEAQAFDRVYRVGQTKAVFVHKLLVSGSVEEDLYELQQRKLQMAFGVMDAQRKGAGGSVAAGAATTPADSMSFKRKTAASGITLAELKNIFLAQPSARQPRY